MNEVSDVSPCTLYKRRRPKNKFTPEEDRKIASHVQESGIVRWTIIADGLPGRTARQCRERWVNYLSPDVSTAGWTTDEDELLLAKVTHYGQLWSRIVHFFKGRTDVSIKNRYHKLMRMERKGCGKREMNGVDIPLLADADDEGGAFFIEDNNSTYQNDWSWDQIGFNGEQEMML
jgi:hypothetical protein